METDSEIEGDLARVLSCMGTNDKEVIIRQFQQVLGDHSLSPETCHFFLDMSNWNLQTALGAYYDYGAANNVSGLYEAAALNMQLVMDVTIGEGEAVPPNTRFVKTWRVRNNGLVAWPAGSCIVYTEGAILSSEQAVLVPSIEPGEEVDISVDMQSPAEAGMYQSRWHLNTFQRVPFGESIWCIITVDPNGILDITQQLASAPLADRTHPNLFGNSIPLDPVPQGDMGSHPSGSNPFMMNRNGANHQEYNIDEMHMLPDQLKYFARSNPLNIEGSVHTETLHVPPCTPCTPPNENAN